MSAEIKNYVKMCDACQRVKDKFQSPPTELQPVSMLPDVWKQVTSAARKITIYNYTLYCIQSNYILCYYSSSSVVAGL